MSLDVPLAGAVSSHFAVAGWALDSGVTGCGQTGTGVDQVAVWAFNSTTGAATFVGSANLGVSRPDVGAWIGAQFSTSGFGMTGTLPPGTYDVNAYARSTITGLFMAAVARRITVLAPTSIPAMYVDAPGENQTVTQFFQIGGWAVDLGSSSGNGVSAVHVWGFPVSGAPAIFVGAASVGGQRPDVGGAFGNARFAGSGFSFQGNLPPGEYYLVVYAWSDVVQTFNNWKLVRIRVV